MIELVRANVNHPEIQAKSLDLVAKAKLSQNLRDLLNSCGPWVPFRAQESPRHNVAPLDCLTRRPVTSMTSSCWCTDSEIFDRGAPATSSIRSMQCANARAARLSA
jgi:hypothetical protein